MKHELKIIDRVKIKVRGGKGGDGCVSFRREKYVPKGGPDGGDGGDGGNVILKVNENIITLRDYLHRAIIVAGDGKKGRSKNRTGAKGKDEILLIPPGTRVFDANNNELICDLTENNQEFIIAKGGKSGKGNAKFASSINRTPTYAEKGKEGEYKEIILDVALIADVGLVGFPNAGKSTFLSAISDARPMIAEFPFTTLQPILGVYETDDFKRITIADMPGIIEGAHKGKGLGLNFLKHIQRTRLLLFIIDGSKKDCHNDFKILRKELGNFSNELKNKKYLVAVNKIDIIDNEKINELKKIFGKDTFFISAKEKIGIESLMKRIVEKLTK